MIKKIGLLFLFSLLFMTTCTSGPPVPGAVRKVVFTEAAAAAPFFSSMPAGNRLVFIGVAGKRSDPKETVQFALEDAARRVAAYHRVYGEYALVNNIGSGTFDYAHDTYMSLSYDVEGSKQYVDALQFNADTDSLEMENTLIVRTTYPAALSVPVAYRPVYGKADQKPDWVENPPLEVAGYEVGVGYSGRFSSLADTCTNSFHNAIFAIIRNINSVSQNNESLYQNTGSLFGYYSSSDNLLYSYGMLTGFYVLDTWIDPKDKTVWTLAIAKKPDE
jgi:hypothetical protein